ncbi:MAG: redox-regulated ATPase YchF [Planctomycetes bacterium]|nr:redox-regulated ATPase YchF [Planctomycetota bacterium]NOG54722.1 redox-regulated ATPase YchF [Planctomycetota bacterium]
MEIGIVGLPNVGKSALFKALTGMTVEVSNYPFTTTHPIRGSAIVPDNRLDIISRFVPTKKIVHANVDLVDIPAIVPGSSQGEGMGNAFLEHIRQVDAMAHVVRCFESEDVSHTHDTLDPVRDAQEVETELLLADLEVIESAVSKAERRARIGKDAEALKRIEVGQKAAAVLESERPLRFEDWTAEERKELRALGMITLRPVLYVANISEDDIAQATADPESVAHVKSLRDWVRDREGEHAGLVPVSASLEAELAEISNPAEHDEMLEAMGLTEPALAVLARSLYALIGVSSFYTAGPKEVRAWTIPNGSLAPDAAGVIHSDIQRGFIRCETYSVTDLEQYGSEQAIKTAGHMRVEGKNYVIQDGDVCHFLFNV